MIHSCKFVIAILLLLSIVSCANPKWFWCSSSGIMTYNRHTGQFEVVWENEAKPSEVVHDTIFIETIVDKDSSK